MLGNGTQEMAACGPYIWLSLAVELPFSCRCVTGVWLFNPGVYRNHSCGINRGLGLDMGTLRM